MQFFSSMSSPILVAIRELLTSRGVEFAERQHPPTATSEDSARARGEELGVGAKALLLKTDDVFRLFVLPADRKLDSKSVKQHFQVKSVRFATPEELLGLTGLVPGAVPPFGPPILPFELYADDSIGVRYPKVAFNAGSLTDSIIMPADDWIRIANPTRFQFAKA
jgi:prolyl-tRNA editing enzyme YbaK/EbsC (Cys-tRNA(Pro) deacylase)